VLLVNGDVTSDVRFVAHHDSSAWKMRAFSYQIDAVADVNQNIPPLKAAHASGSRYRSRRRRNSQASGEESPSINRSDTSTRAYAHFDEQRWLRSVEIVNAPAVGDEAKALNLIHKVLERGVRGLEEFRLEKALDDPVTVPVICDSRINTAPCASEGDQLTLLAESTARHDESMVQGDQRASALDAIAQGRLVRVSCQLRPEAVYSLRERFRQRIGHVVQELWIRRELRQGCGLQLEAFAREVVVHEIEHGAFREVARRGGGREGRAREGSKVVKHVLRGLGSRLVDDGFGIHEEVCQVERLEYLFSRE
jgi:hypothetical protein